MPEPETEARRQALRILAGAEPAALAALWAAWPTKPAAHPVRKAEAGLVMIRGRAGGGGNPFNLGEATVSRASVRLDGGPVGHGYCLGRSLEKAETIAVFDALFQLDPAAVEARVLTPLRADRCAADARRRDETAATKVDFFTLVRGDD
jgi:alpha-D-ribose 1-methylphosphonate 5-triphosphate synthase subunit PhnG